MINEIKYIDFTPEVIEKSIWKGSKYEPLEEVMQRVNEWIRKNYNVKIINVETIAIPKSHRQESKDAVSKVNMSGGFVYILQIVRVWYS